MQKEVRYRYASERIDNRVFFIPFAYYFQVRLGTVQKLLSWLLLYVVPTSFYMLLQSGLLFSFTFSGLLNFAINDLLVLLLVFNMYELGYIHNDTYSTLHELTPALRLYPENLVFFYRNAKKIFSLRIVYSVTATLLLLLLNGFAWGVLRVVVATTAMSLIFLWYNYWRGMWNVLLYPFLVFSRYLPFVLLYPVSYRYIFLLFMVYPCVAWLERFSMPRHRFNFMKVFIPEEKSKTLFRLAYYLVCIIVLHLSYICLELPQLELLPFDMLALYRAWLWLYLQHHSVKNYLQG
ncbi:MAG: hypothetical protein IJS73_06090 [Paludibacteraceae bacterium]|nr:hypothetical protein [Paludibacteraceae bacterium]